MAIATTLDLTVGSLLIGTLISTMLYGVVSLQFYVYCRAQNKDTTWFRGLIGLVWVLETIHTIVSWVDVYNITVTEYGNSNAIGDYTAGMKLLFALTCCVGSIVQSFFGYRILLISHSFIIPVITWLGATVRFGFGIALAVVPSQFPNIQVFESQDLWIAITPLAVSVSNDVLSTASLSYYLSRRVENGTPKFAKTRKLVDKLILYTIETGLVTSIFGVAILITDTTMPKNYVAIGLSIIYPRLFSISLLTSVNVRDSLRRMVVNTSNHLPLSVTSASPRTREGIMLNDMGGTHPSPNVYPPNNRNELKIGKTSAEDSIMGLKDISLGSTWREWPTEM